MAASVQVYVLGDQTYDIFDLLFKLLHKNDDVLLSAFFEASCKVLVKEVALLSWERQVACPRFAKIADLLRFWKEGTLNPALGQALTSICHIAAFLSEHGAGRRPFPSPESACFTARCTGFLSAVAISCATNPSELFTLGLSAVRVAFRVGACAWDMGSRIYSDANMRLAQGEYEPYPAWTAALSGLDAAGLNAKIIEYATSKGLDSAGSLSKPYISAKISETRSSVSAPPDVLDSFLSTVTVAGKINAHRIPITGPYHAPQLYTSDDINSVIAPLLSTSTANTTVPIISSSTGEVIPGTPFSDALRLAVTACLQQTIRWDLAAEGVASLIQQSKAAESFTIHHIAATADSLGTAIQAALGPTSSIFDLKVDGALPIAGEAIPAPSSKSKLAILSMSGRFPSAPSMEGFWDVLRNGVDTHEPAPPSRWDVSAHVGEGAKLAKNVSGTGNGCWLHEAGQFDARFFNMSPREAPQVDPAQRMALLTAAEALEQAGIVPNRTPSTKKDRVGVYFGCTSNDWMETNSAQDIDTYFIPGGNRAFIPGRINYHFKFSGPSYTIDTACSSSLAALHMACNALWRGEIDTAIIGGTNVLTNPDMTAGLDRGHFLSRTGNCKTFDDTADGYCRGEAVATAIMKRLDDAVADKDPIQACILSIATNHSAEADSITRPHVGAQQALFESVIADAGVTPKDISYCEMHGTGTQAGDAGETTSVLRSLAPAEPAFAKRKPSERLYIGAAKSNVGHGEAAAGVTSLAKVLLMLKNATIPPHCGIKTKINHKLPDLDSRNVSIAKEAVAWPGPKQGAKPRQVLLNNFSAAGGNTALVLEDAPTLDISQEPDTRSHHVVAVSAKTPGALENNLKNMISWIDGQSDSSNLTLARLSYTTTARRMHHHHRVALNVTDLAAAKKALQVAVDQKQGSQRPAKHPRFVFSFTGQGAQFSGMGAELYRDLAGFRNDINRYDQICQQLQLPSIRAIFEDPATAFSEATPTEMQLALVCFQMALYRMWTSFGVIPTAVVGHSIGEYAALYAANVLSQTDVIRLVGRRAQLLERNCRPGTHAMLAVRSNSAELETLLGRAGSDYEFSCLNGKDSVVLGGTKEQITKIRPKFTQRGLSNTFLDVPYAYHTSQVNPILASLESVALGVRFGKPTIPVISPAEGKVLTEASDFNADYIVRHCRSKVDMHGALTAAKNLGILDEKMIGLEIGPGPVVVRMVREVAGNGFQTFASSRKDESTWKLLATAMSAFYAAGAELNWTAYHQDFESTQQVLDLPAYAWQMQEYWMQYVNDWSLRKGDPPLRLGPVNIESSSIHKILENTISNKGGQLIVESDLSRPDLHPMVQGHKVYGVPLCTPSVYADIALTIGEYAKDFVITNGKPHGVDVGTMTIQSALVANSEGKPQLLRVAGTLDPKEKTVAVTFSSVNAQGKVTEQHSKCTVRFYDLEKTKAELAKTGPGILARTRALAAQIGESGNTFRYSKAMIYKMVGQLADFDPNYRALKAITLDSDTLEASGVVDLRKVLKEGTFNTNPAYIDALSQLGGFVMNGNEGVDLDKELFVNHGWESLKLFEKVDPEKIYSTHVHMSEGADKLWNGDVTIFEGERVVGIIGGVALQGVPKRLMTYIVNAAAKKIGGVPGAAKEAPKAQAKPAAAAPAKPATQAKPAAAPVAAAPKTVAKKTTVVTKKPIASTAVTTTMQIISEESGIAVEELTDETQFDDVGVDSLLGIMVTSRIRDELNIEVESTVFMEMKTIGNFKTFLLGLTGETAAEVEVIEVVEEEEVAPVEVAPVVVNVEATVVVAAESDAWPKILAMIAEESGIATAELTGETTFADIGIDSLLSLVVCSRIRDELDIDVPDHSLFLEHPTVDSLKLKFVAAAPAPEASEDVSDSEASIPSSGSSVSNLETPATEVSMLSPMTEKPNLNLEPVKPAWSLTIQGSAKHASQRLFLFPDGCGAATSYLKLPPVGPEVAVIGFNSPYMKNPHAMNERTLPEIVSSYIAGLQKHQPHGPYHLGGWSAGGILAYAIAQELTKRNEEIATLLLIDSPPPNAGLDRLPKRFFDHCSAVGIFGSEMGEINRQNADAPKPKLPEWLMPHFEASIELLHDYHAPPFAPGKAPNKVEIVWAGACAFDDGRYAKLPDATAEEEASEGMKFLSEPRTDWGAGLWADLFPQRDIKVSVVPGDHHFSMMRGEGGKILGGYIKEAMGC